MPQSLPNTFRDLHEKFGEFSGKTIEFSKAIEKLEGQFDAKMRAKLVGIAYDFNDKVVRLTVDCSAFETYNDAFARTDYYDKAEVPCLTAKQAGQYNNRVVLWFSQDDQPQTCIRLIDLGERTLTFSREQLEFLAELLEGTAATDAVPRANVTSMIHEALQ